MRTRVRVWVGTRAARDRLVGRDAEGTVHIHVTASPIDGKANAAVTRVLAEGLRLPPRDVVLIRGHTSRTKVFEVDLSEDDLDRLLPTLPSD